jgi:hypothetical protein
MATTIQYFTAKKTDIPPRGTISALFDLRTANPVGGEGNIVDAFSNAIRAIFSESSTLPFFESIDVMDSRTVTWLKFQGLIRSWREERGISSSITEAAMMPSYQKIIGMGETVVPLILRQLRSEGNEPDQWFWALRVITGANPIRPEDQGNFRKMADAWLKWGEAERNAW